MLIETDTPCCDGPPNRLGDELEVSYPNIRPIPHRGLVYRITRDHWGVVEIYVIHNSKSGGGVHVVTLAEFAQWQPLFRRRSPESPDHTRAILDRATRLNYHPYNWLSANCEQFTDYCYNGFRGESPTLQKGFLGAGAVVVGLIAVSHRN